MQCGSNRCPIVLRELSIDLPEQSRTDNIFIRPNSKGVNFNLGMHNIAISTFQRQG